MLCYFISLV